MSTCPNCGKTITEDVRICPHCNHILVEENTSGDKLIGCFVAVIFSLILLVIGGSGYLIYQVLHQQQHDNSNNVTSKFQQSLNQFEQTVKNEFDDLFKNESRKKDNISTKTTFKDELKPLVPIKHQVNIESGEPYKPTAPYYGKDSKYLNKPKSFGSYKVYIPNASLTKTYDQIVNAVQNNDATLLKDTLIVDQQKATEQQIKNWLNLMKEKSTKKSFIHHLNENLNTLSNSSYESRQTVFAKSMDVLYVTKLKKGYQFEIPMHEFSFSSDLQAPTTIDMFGKSIKYQPERFGYYYLFLPVGQYTLPMQKTEGSQTFDGKLEVRYEKYYQIKEKFDVVELYIYPSMSQVKQDDMIYHVGKHTGKLDSKEKRVGFFDVSKPLEVYIEAKNNGKTIKSETKTISKKDIKNNHYLYMNLDFK
ncbi:zinc ribbon domain-containing protein [Macrococcus sp. DPC7161]|uniref:zinc ribbon domain-containing protein n=1 Tax=Macrococcus sp. DPC7161 TaxID=2507060 RepID=UPI00100B7977|nr:zinc ribbon domain-containing protein [Macrococcus sp. DPC7161]RXK19154.1 zinc ribbon domain-containing protein [Macrococcus sp. DPC7161]